MPACCGKPAEEKPAADHHVEARAEGGSKSTPTRNDDKGSNSSREGPPDPSTEAQIDANGEQIEWLNRAVGGNFGIFWKGMS